MARRTRQVVTRDGRTLTASQSHAAQYSEHHFPIFDRLLAAEAGLPARRLRVLDPMAGLGGIHHLSAMRYETVANEIEPVFVEVARQLHSDRETVCGDATALDFPDGSFDAVVVSPSYGSRLRDSHRARDFCKSCTGFAAGWDGAPCRTCWGYGVSLRRSYTHDARRLAGDSKYTLDRRSSGTLSARSAAYWELHEKAWAEARRVLVDGGLMLLDVKDFVERYKVVPVAAGHRAILEALGFHVEAEVPVVADGLRNGANHSLRTDTQTILVARKPAVTAEVAA